jgi:hypothetical protein
MLHLTLIGGPTVLIEFDGFSPILPSMSRARIPAR